MYEDIIEDLRANLEKASEEQFRSAQQLEALSRRALRADQLEEEIAMYRDTVKSVAVESQRFVSVYFTFLARVYLSITETSYLFQCGSISC